MIITEEERIKNKHPLYIWNARELPSIEGALIAYRSLSLKTPAMRIPELVADLMRTNVRELVANFSDDQIEGKIPLVRHYTQPEGLTPVTLRLWWNKKAGHLDVDYLD